jgi:hypothetical protein
MSRRNRRLGPLERARLAAEILKAYLLVRRLLRCRTLPDTVAALRSDAAVVPPSAASLALGRHLASATVRTITLLPANSRCLMRSLVLTKVMARRGLSSELILSAAPGPEFEAHAWVEHAGEPLLLPGGAEHQPLLRL